MTTSDFGVIITAAVAVAALGLSIFNFYLSRHDKRPQLRTKIANGFITQGSDISETMLTLDVANSGEKQVIVSSVEVLLGLLGKEKAMFTNIEGSQTFPFALPPGQNASFWIPIEKFAGDLQRRGYKGKVRIKGNFRDAIGNNYKSKKFTIDLDKWNKRRERNNPS